MKKLVLVLFLTLLYSAGFSQEFPAKPNTLVNDYTGTLSPTQKQQLENKLVAFDDSTSTQIAIAIIKSVGEYDINEYALGLGRSWGVGGAKNNGVMIVVSLGDRKISMQTGYGLEGALPDIITKRIIDNEIKPYFKQGDYYSGLEAGTTAIIKYSKGEYKNDNPKAVKKKGTPGAGLVIIVIIIIIVLIVKKGGGGGGNGQVLGSRGVGSALLWGALLGSSGRNSGSSWGGGGSSGGGFGGFGGGSFGGGGSSGSW
jgi:uncharacterized protein